MFRISWPTLLTLLLQLLYQGAGFVVGGFVGVIGGTVTGGEFFGILGMVERRGIVVSCKGELGQGVEFLSFCSILCISVVWKSHHHLVVGFVSELVENSPEDVELLGGHRLIPTKIDVVICNV